MSRTDTPDNTKTSPAAPRNGLDRFFSITERGSTVAREVRGGLVTFVTMVYIVVLNPIIIGTAKDVNGNFLGAGHTPNLAAVAAVTGGRLVVAATAGEQDEGQDGEEHACVHETRSYRMTRPSPN